MVETLLEFVENHCRVSYINHSALEKISISPALQSAILDPSLSKSGKALLLDAQIHHEVTSRLCQDLFIRTVTPVPFSIDSASLLEKIQSIIDTNGFFSDNLFSRWSLTLIVQMIGLLPRDGGR